jgi:cytoskeleton protein RodZ
LELLPASAPPRLNADDRGINTPFDAPGQANNASMLSFLATPPALMVVLLMVAAVVVYFYPVASKDPTVTDKLQAVAQAVTPEVVAEAVDPPPLVSQGLANSSAIAGPAAVDVANNFPAAASSAPAPSAISSAPSLSTSTVVAVTNLPTSSASVAPANQGSVLQFRAKGTAWVQVTDAKGAQLLSRTLKTGEVVGVAGVLPLAVVVGRVDLTSVELHGKPYDLGPITQNNVARFEVKQ